MRDIKLFDLVSRLLFFHSNASSVKRLEKKSDSRFYQFSTLCHQFKSARYCVPFRSAGLTQKLNFSVGQRCFLTFLKFSTYCYPYKCARHCESCRIPGLTVKRSFSIGERRDLKFLQFSTSCDPGGVRLGCLKDNCVVDLNAEDSCVPSNMLDFLRSGVITHVRS